MLKSIRVSLVVLGFAVMTAVMAGCGKMESPTEDQDHAGQQHGSSAELADRGKDAPPVGAGRTEPGGAKCAAHNAPKELCFVCDAALREPGRLWCNEHGRYEDRCWLCHPDAQDKARAYCNEHFLYEDECGICHPELKTKGNPAAQAGTSKLMCKEHGVPEDECGICHPELAATLVPGHGLKVRLPSAESAVLAGIHTAPPRTGAIAEGIECYAEIAFDQNKFAQIVAPVGGIIQSVAADLGDKVEEGQPLMNLWSATLAEAVAKAVFIHQALDRERRLHAANVTAEQDLQEVEAAHRAACQQARTYGFSEGDIDAMGEAPDEPVYLPVRAPFAGEIVERAAVRGASVEAGKPLFVLADRSTMWAMLHVPESALAVVRVGQQVELRVDALPGQAIMGKLTWIGASMDERTRMVRARAELPNPGDLLKDKMFARARILVRHAEGAVVLPDSAIQRVDGTSIAFVRLADDLYEARAVRLGAKYNAEVEVREGIEPHDQVVVAHGFAVKSQLLIGRLGAGCADE